MPCLETKINANLYFLCTRRRLAVHIMYNRVRKLLIVTINKNNTNLSSISCTQNCKFIHLGREEFYIFNLICVFSRQNQSIFHNDTKLKTLIRGTNQLLELKTTG